MNTNRIITYITQWLSTYIQQSNTNGFVIGISGGIDSAVTSTLCAKTGARVIVLNMPIRQHNAEYQRANEHITWLKTHFDNVESYKVELTPVFEQLENTLPENIQDWLTMANARARLRMTTLYAFASHHKMLVAGTGNKVEDFGVGFFTKYGDGGVDLSPIADLLKTEVYALGKELGIVSSILTAAPTDGLWEDGRNDEDQIGATYPELEWAMNFLENPSDFTRLTERQRQVLNIYEKLHQANLHKMKPVPVCHIPKELKQ